MERAIRLTAVLTHSNDVYVARAVEVDCDARGHTVEEALSNLREALEVYFEDAPLPLTDPDGPIIAPVNVRLHDD
jgi:predicted RNase H-like HicB family nuclease